MSTVLHLAGPPVAVEFTAEALAALPEKLVALLLAAGWSRDDNQRLDLTVWRRGREQLETWKSLDNLDEQLSDIDDVAEALGRQRLDIAIACGGKVVPRDSALGDWQFIATDPTADEADLRKALGEACVALSALPVDPRERHKLALERIAAPMAEVDNAIAELKAGALDTGLEPGSGATRTLGQILADAFEQLQAIARDALAKPPKTGAGVRHVCNDCDGTVRADGTCSCPTVPLTPTEDPRAGANCRGFKSGGTSECCGLAGDYNGFGSDSRTDFTSRCGGASRAGSSSTACPTSSKRPCPTATSSTSSASWRTARGTRSRS